MHNLKCAKNAHTSEILSHHLPQTTPKKYWFVPEPFINTQV